MDDCEALTAQLFISAISVQNRPRRSDDQRGRAAIWSLRYPRRYVTLARLCRMPSKGWGAMKRNHLLMTLCGLLAACTIPPPQPSATSFYKKCAGHLSSFAAMASCGEADRNAVCKPRNHCSSVGDAFVLYTDNLAASIKAGKITEADAWKQWRARLNIEQANNARRAAAARLAALDSMSDDFSQAPQYHYQPMNFAPVPQPSMPPGPMPVNSLMNSYVQPPPAPMGMGEGARGYGGTVYVPAGPDPNPPPSWPRAVAMCALDCRTKESNKSSLGRFRYASDPRDLAHRLVGPRVLVRLRRHRCLHIRPGWMARVAGLAPR
jgi:hypothetical protein